MVFFKSGLLATVLVTTTAVAQTFPYIVKIEGGPSGSAAHFCVGTVIAPRVVVTAAQCVVRARDVDDEGDEGDAKAGATLPDIRIYASPDARPSSAIKVERIFGGGPGASRVSDIVRTLSKGDTFVDGRKPTPEVSDRSTLKLKQQLMQGLQNDIAVLLTATPLPKVVYPRPVLLSDDDIRPVVHQRIKSDKEDERELALHRLLTKSSKRTLTVGFAAAGCTPGLERVCSLGAEQVSRSIGAWRLTPNIAIFDGPTGRSFVAAPTVALATPPALEAWRIWRGAPVLIEGGDSSVRFVGLVSYQGMGPSLMTPHALGAVKEALQAGR